jgi:hypothetical protein
MLFRRNIRKMTQPELVLYLSHKLGSNCPQFVVAILHTQITNTQGALRSR